MNKLKLRRRDNNLDEIDQIIQKFMTHKVCMAKYNSSIDESV